VGVGGGCGGGGGEGVVGGVGVGGGQPLHLCDTTGACCVLWT